MGEFFAFFAAGTDTTANVTNLAMHYLYENPEWADKIVDEYKNAKMLKVATSEQLKQLKSCEAVFNETLRLNGPVSILGTRRALENVTIGKDIQIRKGTLVTVAPLVCHHREETFE